LQIYDRDEQEQYEVFTGHQYFAITLAKKTELKHSLKIDNVEN
jgi:hypothetical protein